jgi:hypothetical protein
MPWRLKPLRHLLRRPARAAGWFAAGIATTLVGIFVGAVAQRYGVFDFVGKPPSVAVQLDEVVGRAAASGEFVVALKRTDLHGTGESSYFMVLRAESTLLQRYRYGRDVSDEVRVYDVDGTNKLRLRYKFHPRGSSYLWVFRTESIGDLDGNGVPEVIGAWEQIAMEPIWPRPVVLGWSPTDSRYEMHPILATNPPDKYGYTPSRPQLVKATPANGYAAGIRRFYVSPTRLQDSSNGTVFSSYAVEDFFVIRSRFGVALVAGFYVAGAGHADTDTVEMLAWSVNFALPAPAADAALKAAKLMPSIQKARVAGGGYVNGLVNAKFADETMVFSHSSSTVIFDAVDAAIAGT